MEVHTHWEAQYLSGFTILVVIYLILTCMFVQFSRAILTYDSQALFNINCVYTNSVSNYVFNFDQLPPELVRKPLHVVPLFQSEEPAQRP